ncbi:MAG TPA: hypothetical protein PLH15_10630 [Spirochaetota bacterium]|nr:hypothetical protein [Spirochaetota bacterium]HQQ24283.1 hypothetical protein [Spirochaetota bacterium]
MNSNVIKRKKVDPKTIRNFITGKTSPRLDTILYLASPFEQESIMKIVSAIMIREKTRIEK